MWTGNGLSIEMIEGAVITIEDFFLTAITLSYGDIPFCQPLDFPQVSSLNCGLWRDFGIVGIPHFLYFTGLIISVKSKTGLIECPVAKTTRSFFHDR
ncbi:MAG TPA: hypothetical protein DCP92_11070 [Nitrospiraceae bacterium]|jgi:hypothetical protein|nr:hypothetical protein [Nitrospiraceae bacterium]